jgi:hypothetical protein
MNCAEMQETKKTIKIADEKIDFSVLYRYQGSF